MEVAGIVLRSVGLAVSFKTCMETFEYVDTKKYGKDYQKAVLKLSILELRLSRWSQQIHFSDDSKATPGDAVVATTTQSNHVQGLLGQIQVDLEDAAKASRRYSLPSTGDDAPLEGTAKLENLTSKFRRLALERQGKTALVAKTKWALKDKRKLDGLISDITSSIESLEIVFPATALQSQLQRKAVVADVQKLIEPSETEEPENDAEPIVSILREATAGVDAQLSQAIDITVKQTASGDSLKDITISHQARVELGDYIAMGYDGPSHGEARGSRTLENMKVSEQARVRVGDNYGGKGVFDD